MCRTVNLAANEAARVDHCSCGSVHLHVGPVMLRLTPDLLPRIGAVLDLAVLRLALPNAPAAPPPGRDMPPQT